MYTAQEVLSADLGEWRRNVANCVHAARDFHSNERQVIRVRCSSGWQWTDGRSSNVSILFHRALVNCRMSNAVRRGWSDVWLAGGRIQRPVDHAARDAVQHYGAGYQMCSLVKNTSHETVFVHKSCDFVVYGRIQNCWSSMAFFVLKITRRINYKLRGRKSRNHVRNYA